MLPPSPHRCNQIPHMPPSESEKEYRSHETIPGAATAQLLLTCEHASNHIPAPYNNLGLPPDALRRHIAYDIGAAGVARRLAAHLACPAILGGASRLLIDLNRGLDDPTLIMKLSDGQLIPGNRHADPDHDRAERDKRIAAWHIPYHDAIEAQISALGDPALLSIHSFTPNWRGADRPWDIGVLWGRDSRLAFPLVSALTNIEGLRVGRNEPYIGGMEGESIHRHGWKNRLLHACLEIRQDHIADEEGQSLWAERLASILPETLKQARRIERTEPH